MSMYGAVPSELREFGLRFSAQQESVAAIQQAVFSALSSTTWVGPARDKFGDDWNSRFNPNLEALKSAFEAAGTEAMSRADALEQAMGVTAAG
jgi:uncharacterized protein YukE